MFTSCHNQLPILHSDCPGGGEWRREPPPNYGREDIGRDRQIASGNPPELRRQALLFVVEQIQEGTAERLRIMKYTSDRIL